MNEKSGIQRRRAIAIVRFALTDLALFPAACRLLAMNFLDIDGPELRADGKPAQGPMSSTQSCSRGFSGLSRRARPRLRSRHLAHRSNCYAAKYWGIAVFEEPCASVDHNTRYRKRSKEPLNNVRTLHSEIVSEPTWSHNREPLSNPRTWKFTTMLPPCQQHWVIRQNPKTGERILDQLW